MNLRILSLCITAHFFYFCSAQSKTAVPPSDKLNNYLNALATDDDLIHASWGFCLMDPLSGDIVASHEKDISLMPASGMKAITTLSALNILGPSYTYTTTIAYDSTLTKGVINGNVYIQGSGDPSLGSGRFKNFPRYDTMLNNWAAQLKAQGITSIKGNIIADAEAFEDYATPGSWNWDDIGQYYGAGPYGLNIFENAYSIYFSSTKTTSRVDSVFPVIEGMTIYNDLKVGSTNDAYIYGAPDSYYRYVVGGIPQSRAVYTVEGSMPDPPLFLAAEFKRILELNGITVQQQATTVYAMKRLNLPINAQRTVLLKYKSPAMRDIIFETDQHSINLYAEALLKTIGKEQLNDGSTASGSKVVRNYWTEKGFDLKGFNMEDGSGLSRLNVITTYQMCKFMQYAYGQKTFALFKDALPVSGESGTLKSISAGTSAQGKVFAKSGSMSKVRSYSGYVQTKSGKLLCFSVMMNNYTCSSAEIKKKLESLMIYMAAL